MNATDYEVGFDKTYENLEALRKATITWDDNDKIILHDAEDNSLTDAFDFNGKTITISGNTKVSPKASDVRFSNTTTATLLKIADGSLITFDGFNNSGGGAIYSYDAVIISGTSTFSGNTATEINGGAILGGSDIKITATTGNIRFEGNKAGSTPIPNAIYMYNNYNNKTLSLAATSGNSVLFYDPIASKDNLKDLQIKINEQDDKLGTVLFDMSNHSGADKESNIYGHTTVSYGTFALKDGAVYGASGNTGNFALQDNATLLVVGKDNKINATGKVTLGGTIAFDLTCVTATTDTALSFNEDSTLTIGKVDIHKFNGDGTFNLAQTTNNTFNTTLPQLTTHGEAITNTRASSATLALSSNHKMLQLQNAPLNGTVIWNTTDGNWDATSENWLGSGTINGIKQFLHGDDVVFNGSGEHEIAVQTGGVTVKSMEIQGDGTWKFTGGEIDGGIINVANSISTTIYFDFDTCRMNQRIEIAQNVTTTIASLDNKPLTFTGFNNNGDGGAIYAGSGSNLTIGAEGSNVIFDANTADYGGAIYSKGNIEIFGTSIFSNNTSSDAGGAIVGEGDVTISGASTFSDNTVTDGHGDAIFSVGDVTIFGTSTFTGNTATTFDGGAIYNYSGDVTISSTSDFFGNTANYFGGAIFCYGGDVTISDNSTSTFSSNTADESGGAIYSYNGDVTITASAGNIVFTENKANNRPNAIYMENDSDYKTLSIAATDGNNVEFYDPIESNSAKTNLQIKINEQDDKLGTVLFDMSKNTGNDKISAIYGNTTIYHGTFAMKGDAVYGADGNSGTFTLQNRATLNFADNARINGNVDLSGTVDITNGKLDIGGNLDLKSGSVLKMTIAENKIVADSVKIDGYVEFDLSSVPNGKTENIIVSRIKTLDQTQLDSRFNLSTLLVTL